MKTVPELQVFLLAIHLPGKRVKDETVNCSTIVEHAWPCALTGEIGGALFWVGHQVGGGGGCRAQRVRVHLHHHWRRLWSEHHRAIPKINVFDRILQVWNVEVFFKEDVRNLLLFLLRWSVAPKRPVGGGLWPHHHHAAPLEPHVTADLVLRPRAVVVCAAEVESHQCLYNCFLK